MILLYDVVVANQYQISDSLISVTNSDG